MDRFPSRNGYWGYGTAPLLSELSPEGQLFELRARAQAKVEAAAHKKALDEHRRELRKGASRWTGVPNKIQR